MKKYVPTRLDAKLEEAREQAYILGLIYIDLDRFKQVNDVYGHHIGDLYLQEAALRMKRQLRAHDSLARLGGDEFAALDSTTTLATTQPMFWTRTAIASNSYTNAGSTKRYVIKQVPATTFRR